MTEDNSKTTINSQNEQNQVNIIHKASNTTSWSDCKWISIQSVQKYLRILGLFERLLNLDKRFIQDINSPIYKENEANEDIETVKEKSKKTEYSLLFSAIKKDGLCQKTVRAHYHEIHEILVSTHFHDYDISFHSPLRAALNGALKTNPPINFKFTYDNEADDNEETEETEEVKSSVKKVEKKLFYQKIFFGAPGTGKSQSVKELTGESAAERELNQAQKELKKATEEDEKTKAKEKIAETQKELQVIAEHVFRTTFHPDYDYASFVGSYKPVPKDGHITYEFMPEVFANAYVKAWQEWIDWETEPEEKQSEDVWQKHQVWLVIEEINRGNCAQIFGDLFQLLDRWTKNGDGPNEQIGFSKYAIRASRDFADWLKGELKDIKTMMEDIVDEGKLCLPPNLNIVATMNTSDQSLFPMDSAFKRRWDWAYVPINLSEEETENAAAGFRISIGDKEYSWIRFLKIVNPQIRELTQSEDKQLGTYFITDSVSEDEFISKVVFYLWSEICKDEYHNNANFMRSTYRRKAADAIESDEFTFNELFEVGKAERAKILQGFMEHLKGKSKANGGEEIDPLMTDDESAAEGDGETEEHA